MSRFCQDRQPGKGVMPVRPSARTQALITALISFCAMLASYAIRYRLLRGIPAYGLLYYEAIALFSAALHYAAYRVCFSAASAEQPGLSAQISRAILCECLCFLITLALLYAAGLQYVSRIAVLIGFALNVAAICAMHGFFLSRSRRAGLRPRSVLLIGEGPAAARYAAAAAHPQAGHHLCGHVAAAPQPFDCPYLGDYGALEQALASASPDLAVIALPAAQYVHIDPVIALCEAAGLPLRIIPCYESRISAHLSASLFEGVRMVDIRTVPLDSPGNALVKRAMDVALASLLLLLLSPLMLGIAAGVKLSTHDTVLFRQVRVGKDKKPFTMLKFRSMRRNDGETSAWSTRADSRRTRFGALLRKLSLDELPQLFNVLRGDMSLVGPRPELPCFVEQFRDEIPLYMLRHRVKPGITGYAQVSGLRGDTSVRARLERDIAYIEGWSIWLDLRILLATPRALVNDETLPPLHKAS